jgi:hypothetical protein
LSSHNQGGVLFDYRKGVIFNTVDTGVAGEPYRGLRLANSKRASSMNAERVIAESRSALTSISTLRTDNMSYSYFNQFRHYVTDWALSNQLGYWNACSITDLIQHFGTSGSRLSYTVNMVLTRAMYSAEKVADAIGVDKKIIAKGRATTYLSDDDINVFVEKKLRICPICISLQYHSWFHQLLPLTYCPIHTIELTTECPFCGRQFLNCYVRDIHNYFSCCNCGHPLANLDRYDQCISENDTKAFEKIEKILLKRKSGEIIFPPLQRFKMEHNNPYFHANVLKLWESLYGHRPLDPKLFKIRLPHNFHLDSTYGYRYLPKSIFNIVKNHKWCIDKIGQLGFWLNIDTEIQDVRLCPYALAFICFRMYWESKDCGHGIKFDYDHPVKHKIHIDTCESLYSVLIDELEYLEMFKGCLALTTASFEKREVRVPTPEEIASQSIYWEGFKPSNEVDGRIVYFQRRAKCQEPILGPPSSHFQDLEDNLEKIIRQVSGISQFCKHWPDHPKCN